MKKKYNTKKGSCFLLMTLNSPQDLRLFSTMRNEVTLQSDSRAYFDGNVISLGFFVNCGSFFLYKDFCGENTHKQSK